MARSEKVAEIWGKYIQFMIDWSNDNVPSEDKELFQTDVRKFLVDRIGMTIPEGAKIFLDHSMTWPAIYIKVKDTPDGEGEYIVLERIAGMKMIDKFGNNNPIDEIINTWRQRMFEMTTLAESPSDIRGAMKASGMEPKNTEKLTVPQLPKAKGCPETEPVQFQTRGGEAGMVVNIPEAFNGCDIGIRLPFFPLDDGVFGIVKFDDGAEISLTTCS